MTLTLTFIIKRYYTVTINPNLQNLPLHAKHEM